MIRKTNLAHRSNYGEKRSTSAIKYIVLHYTANDGDSDENNANYFKTGGRESSAHIFVDDDSCTQSVPDDYVAWSVGGNKYANTNGGKFYGKATNANTLNIEMCDTLKNGKYEASVKTQENAITIAREKMKQYNIPIDRVIRHYDVTGKLCPSYFVDEKAWADFKNRIVQTAPADPDGVVKNNVGIFQSKTDKMGEVSYQGHLRNTGWANWQSDGAMIGSTGQNRRMEALKIKPVKQMDVTVHIRDIGDKLYKNITKDTIIGTTGQGLRLEALKIESSDTVYLYRVHQKDLGWSAWCVNGQWAGQKGQSKQIEAIEIIVADIAYIGHVQGSGDTIWMADGMTAGTTGQQKRLEAIRIKSQHCGDVYAKAHIQGIGWKDYGKINQNTVIGTEGDSLRLECLCLKGDFEWRAHIQGTGWSQWTKADGVATLGTVGESLRIEAVELRKAA